MTNQLRRWTTCGLCLWLVAFQFAARAVISILVGVLGLCLAPEAWSQCPQSNIVVITTQPVSQSICASGTVMFSVGATGNPVAYQWRWNGTNLVDGPGVSGSTTPTLTLSIPMGACLEVPAAGSVTGVVWGNVGAGLVYNYQASGCVGVNQNGNVVDPDGRKYVGQCSGSSTTGATSSAFCCPGQKAWSLVGKVNGTCVQLGSGGSFVAPADGLLTLYMNDDNYADNSGSWNACISNGLGDYDVIVYGACGSQTSSVAVVTIEQPAVAPAGFCASVSSSDRVDLVWTNNGYVDGIKIERAPDAGGSPGTWAQIGTVGAGVASYGDTGVVMGVTYWYRTRTYNVCGDSAYSAAVTVDVGLPLAPSGVTGIAVATNQINLSWADNSNNETGFKIERAPDVGGNPGTWTQIDAVGINVTGYSDTNVPPYTAYWYRVRAYDGVGDSPYSDPSYVSIVPAAPSNLTASPYLTWEITITWATNSADQDGFAIERAPDAGGAPGTWVQIATQGRDFVAYSDVGLTAGTTYWYRIRAFNSVGYSPYSNVASATTLSIPTAPSNLIATSVSGSPQISLGWVLNSTNASGFEIERALDNSGAPGTWGQIAIAFGSHTTNYNDSSAASGTIYWYRVRAYNIIGNSPYSNFASAGTTGTPPAPANLVAMVVASNRVDLGWSSNSGNVTGFAIERAVGNGSFTQIGTVNSNITTYSDYGVMTNKTYHYQMRSYNSYGYSTYTPQVSVTIPGLPLGPSSLTATVVSSNQINLVWKDNATNEVGYKVERSLDNLGSPGTWGQIGTVSTNVTSYSDTGLAATTRYWYRVRATNVSGDSPYSNLANASTAQGQNVWINPLSDKWEIGPNWSQGAPSSWQAGLLISNANPTTVTVDAATVASNAVNSCMSVGAVTIFSPTGNADVLSLSNAGTATPLHVLNALTITNGGGISITNAALVVDGTFGIDGNVALQPDAQVTATNGLTCVGLVATGQVTMTGGAAALRTLVVASNAFSVGTFTMSGGSMVASNVFIGAGTNSMASMLLKGGQFIATNGTFGMELGRFGNGQVTVSTGATLRTRFMFVGGGDGTVGNIDWHDYSGRWERGLIDNVTVGFNSFASSSPSTGTAWVLGGQLISYELGN